MKAAEYMSKLEDAVEIKTFPDIDLRRVGRGSGQDPVLGNKRFYPYASGRAAVHAAARMLASESTKTVHLPFFHCGVEVEGFLRAGYKIRFYPVNSNLSIDLDRLSEETYQSGDVFFVIHYFGFPQPIKQLSAYCHERSLLLIEDCAHGLYSKVDNQFIGSYGDLGVFSMRKTIALPNGGGLLVNKAALPAPPRGRKRLVPALIKSALRSVLENEVRRGGLVAVPARIILKGHKGVTGCGVSAEETRCIPQGESPSFFEDRRYCYDQAISFLSRYLLNPMPFEEIAACRRHNYKLLHKALASDGGLEPVFGELPQGAVPLCLPVWVDSSDRWVDALSSSGVEAFVFGRHHHPLLSEKMAAQSANFRKSILGLPVHQNLNQRDIEAIIWAVNNVSK